MSCIYVAHTWIKVWFVVFQLLYFSLYVLLLVVFQCHISCMPIKAIDEQDLISLNTLYSFNKILRIHNDPLCY